MKNLWLLLPVICWLTGFSSLRADRAQTNFYQYLIDLKNTENDRLKIELITPQLEEKKVRFLMPKIIPGTYTVYDFGRFVSDLKAFDQSGQELEVVEKDINTWEIREAQRLYRIEYWVDDTFDATTGKQVSGMSGTNIEKGKHYLFNFHGFLGYLENYSRLRFEVSITAAEGLSGSSAQDPIRSFDHTSVYAAPDYNFLVDNPVMYCKADTTSVRVGNAEVLISVFSPGGHVSSSYVADQFRRLLDAQQAYLGGKLPVDRYAFLMYFLEQDQAVGTGALEHNYSSVYVLPDLPQEQISPMLVDIAAHEFFHIVTPLTVHSEEIHYFDFNDPDMSRHLWMYEGVTEYFAHHVQLQQELIDLDQYLSTIGNKIAESLTLYTDELAFTRMSRKCLDQYSDEYGNVYQKGALIGLCLDIELRRLSGGSYGLIDLMKDLGARFGATQPFRDKALFREIEALTYPEIGDFLRTYVAGNEPLPLKRIFAQIGVIYQSPRPSMEFTLGRVSLAYNPETQRIFVNNVYGLNEFGRALAYKTGDEIHSFQGMEVDLSDPNAYIEKVIGSMKEGAPFEVKVYRKNEAGEFELKTLRAKTVKVEQMGPPSLQPVAVPTRSQQELLEDWMKK